MEGLYWSEGFTIIPRLRQFRTPTLVIHGDHDFVPVVCATHIAEAIPGGRLVVLEDSGHFSSIDAPEEVHKAIDEFFASA
jgi:pimeloyl-ACP methyl ester carboxylesterase